MVTHTATNDNRHTNNKFTDYVRWKEDERNDHKISATIVQNSSRLLTAVCIMCEYACL